MAAPIIRYNITFTFEIGVALSFSNLCDITDNTEYRDMFSIEADGDSYEQGNLIIKLNNWCSTSILTKEDMIKIRDELFPTFRGRIECKAEYIGGDLGLEVTI